MQELKEKGVAIIFISHRIWEVARICDRLVAFRNGETVGELDFATQPREEKLIIPLITGPQAKETTRKRSTVREKEIARQSPEARPRHDDVCLHGQLSDISFALRAGRFSAWEACRGRGRKRSS